MTRRYRKKRTGTDGNPAEALHVNSANSEPFDGVAQGRARGISPKSCLFDHRRPRYRDNGHNFIYVLPPPPLFEPCIGAKLLSQRLWVRGLKRLASGFHLPPRRAVLRRAACLYFLGELKQTSDTVTQNGHGVDQAACVLSEVRRVLEVLLRVGATAHASRDATNAPLRGSRRVRIDGELP